MKAFAMNFYIWHPKQMSIEAKISGTTIWNCKASTQQKKPTKSKGTYRMGAYIYKLSDKGLISKIHEELIQQ